MSKCGDSRPLGIKSPRPLLIILDTPLIKLTISLLLRMRHISRRVLAVITVTYYLYNYESRTYLHKVLREQCC